MHGLARPVEKAKPLHAKERAAAVEEAAEAAEVAEVAEVAEDVARARRPRPSRPNLVTAQHRPSVVARERAAARASSARGGRKSRCSLMRSKTLLKK